MHLINSPAPPPPQPRFTKKHLYNHCFQFLLDITVVTRREIEGNGYATIFFLGGGVGGRGLNKVHHGHMIMVNSRNYNGNGYKLLAKRFSEIIWVGKRILMIG